MREPLLQLLFPKPVTSFSSASAFLIRHPIDLIISDLFVLPVIREVYERNIMTYIFVPNSLMAFMHYINMSMNKIESDDLGFDFDRQMHAAIPLAKGLICNSILELDEEVLNKLRRQSVPGSNIPILFVAPLMSEDLGQKLHVRSSPVIYLFSSFILYIYSDHHCCLYQTMVRYTMGESK
jgi:hypothetical protein